MNKTEVLQNIRVVLSRPSHPGNIGAAARAMKTMGLRELALVAPRQFPHPDAEARASGALEILQSARVYESLQTALDDCVLVAATSSRHRELPHETMDVRAGARQLIEAAQGAPTAIVFGNERTGLSREEMSACRIWMHIPADPRYPSLNLAAAVQVVAYELRMALVCAAVPSAEFQRATSRDIDGLYRHVLEVMRTIGYFDPSNPKRLAPRLQRLLARAQLEADEVQILRGFLKAIEKARLQPPH